MTCGSGEAVVKVLDPSGVSAAVSLLILQSSVTWTRKEGGGRREEEGRGGRREEEGRKEGRVGGDMVCCVRWCLADLVRDAGGRMLQKLLNCHTHAVPRYAHDADHLPAICPYCDQLALPLPPPSFHPPPLPLLPPLTSGLTRMSSTPSEKPCSCKKVVKSLPRALSSWLATPPPYSSWQQWTSPNWEAPN